MNTNIGTKQQFKVMFLLNNLPSYIKYNFIEVNDVTNGNMEKTKIVTVTKRPLSPMDNNPEAPKKLINKAVTKECTPDPTKEHSSDNLFGCL